MRRDPPSSARLVPAISGERVVVADPLRRTRPRLAVAALRAGALGVVDIADPAAAGVAGALEAVTARASGAAVRIDHRHASAAVQLHVPGSVETLILAGPAAPGTGRLRAAWPGQRLLAEVTSLAEARRAQAAGVDGLLAKGAESGGRVGDTESFVLLQQVVRLGLPVWVQGGIGLHTAAAAVAAGATGVVLDAQLALVRECELDERCRAAVRAMDGSETRVVGGHRVFTRPDLPSARLAADADPAEVAARLGEDLHRDLVPVGQDGAVAADLAARFATVGGVVTAVHRHIDGHLAAAGAAEPLAPGHGVARSHGTRHPVAQGPMTRVSDRPGFAAAVADAGGLPFVALALMDAAQARALLEETAERLGGRPWGVGVLGFVPPDLRDEQLDAIRAVRPPFALIAGGRPSQAAPLEADGVRTYLHAPSPGLIDAFARAGARRFVFEGRECGGHVGPRSSFVLWEAAVDRLSRLDDPEHLDLLFAGGVHDERSAAAVAAVAAPLVERGARVGVLMGTGYLFTTEAVAHGAITPAFQQEALACGHTSLLETAPGHATRCAPTPYVAAFTEARARLEASGVDPRQMWEELEALNLGRLRIASRGLRRDGDDLRPVGPDEQRAEGMFMLGQVAALRHEVTTLEALHASVTSGATRHLADRTATVGAVVDRVREPPPRFDVAVVGMSAVMPGARDVEGFWANIVAGVDAVTEVPPSRWDAERYYDPQATTVGAGRRTPSKWGGFVPDVGFDALGYGLPPASLGSIEAVQLLALEVAARALADAGYATRDFDRSRASVVFGAEAGNDLSAAYNLRATLPSHLPRDGAGEGGRLPGALEAHLPELTEDSFPGVLANVIAGRIANRLDLGGVNYTVDAACASSLAALDLACKELAWGVSDLVLCGGADLHNGINDFLLFASVHALSPRGRCRPFDAAADGIALGEGVACLALKRLADAERDGDRIYAVVEAVGGASDGRALGLTAPRAEGQRRALDRAYAQAGRSPAAFGLVEAHGTGTVVGDATELGTLTERFTAVGAGPGSCVLGSVKSQIGHTKCAAGLAGLIKAVRAVYHGVLPPTVGIDEPNPRYDEATSPFAFVDRAMPWVGDDRCAGVSAFGFGGTNFHAVVSSYDGDDGPGHGVAVWPAELFLVRAADPAGGREAVAELAALVGRIASADPHGERHRLADLARTVSETGEGAVQVALVATDLADLGRQLASVLAGEARASDGVFVAPPVALGEGPPPLALVFPGQGSQRVGMLADLFVAFPSLRRHLRAGEAWTAHLYPARAFSPEAHERQAAALTDTRVAQPALGMVELAVADLLGQAGVVPSAAAGHSYGELVALALAGAFDAATLLDLSAARGRAVHEAAGAAADPGAMAAARAPAADLAAHLARHPEVVVANHNGPTQTVVAGPTAAVEALVADLRDAGTSARRLPVACAFHSPVVAGAGERLAAALAGAPVAPPGVPVWCNATAEPYPADADGVRRLLALQVARPVRFAEQVEAMYAAGTRVFVEAGPGRVLTGLVDGILGDRPHLAVACDGGGHGVRRFLLALAELAVHGVAVDPTVLFAGRAERIDPAELPRPAPAWRVDGHMVRTADGAPVDGGLRPATDSPLLELPADRRHPTSAAGRGAADVVAEYLQNLRETVAAERDVLLRFLDGAHGGPGADGLGPAPPASGSLAAGPGPGGGWAGGNGAPAGVAGNGGPGDGAPATGNGASGPALGPAGLLHVLTDIVAERTGYPHDMLGPDLDIEADLSIDSIKRVEIIGQVAERIGLAGSRPGEDIDESVVEELAQIKTLRGIVDWLVDATGPAPGDAPAGHRPASPPAPAGPAPAGRVAGGAPGVPERALRYLLATTDLPSAGAAPGAPPPGTAVVVDDGSGVAGALADRLAEAGADARVVPRRGLEPAVAGGGDAAAAEARDLPVGGRHDAGRHDGAHDAAGDRAPAPPVVPSGADTVVYLALAPSGGAPEAFDALAPAALAGARRLACVTPVDDTGAPAAVGGEPGLVRALAHELPDRGVRLIGVDPAGPPELTAALVVDELCRPGPVEVAPTGERRRTRVLREAPRPAGPGGRPGRLPPLDPGAVVLLTGGARGITARVAVALAEAGAAHVELVGRTVLPDHDEPADLAAAADPRALRAALVDRGEASSPAEIEAACRRILAEREVRATAEAIGRAGGRARYHRADVRDGAAVAAIVADVYRRHGRLDGIVHGAGIIEDRALPDKTAESFRRVFDTKVTGARALLAAARDDVGFVLLFGSVSGVLGNRGQVDYAAANDALDALARDADGGRLRGRVLAVDWGPWGGTGMVSDELARAYLRRGIGLIDPDDGIAVLGEELAAARLAGAFPSPQVVVARAHLAHPPEAGG